MKRQTIALMVMTVAALVVVANGFPGFANSPQHLVHIVPSDGAPTLSRLGRSGDKIGDESKITIVKTGASDGSSSVTNANTKMPHMLGSNRGARLHIAPGAYPVYYAIARANGNFGQYIRALTPAEFTMNAL